jgi:hypothetical protein
MRRSKMWSHLIQVNQEIQVIEKIEQGRERARENRRRREKKKQWVSVENHLFVSVPEQ